MAGLVPAIHVFPAATLQDVDHRETLVLAIRRRRIALPGDDVIGYRSAQAFNASARLCAR